ncbi:MAG: methyltransferase [Evtepia gabavorous]
MESVEFLGRYRLTQSDACFKLGRDSVLLARFCTLRPRWSVCDLGCGVGSLLLLLSQREEALDRVGVELDPVAAGLARRNLSDNGLEGQVLTGDLRDRALLKGDRFQLVIANPLFSGGVRQVRGTGPDGTTPARWTTCAGRQGVWPRQGGVSRWSTAPSGWRSSLPPFRGPGWSLSVFSCCPMGPPALPTRFWWRR